MLSGNCTEALSIQATVTISGSSAKLIKNGIAPLPFPLPALLKQHWYIKRGERVRVRRHAPFYATLGYSNGFSGHPWQYVVQPYDVVQTAHRWEAPGPLRSSTHTFVWLPGMTTFASFEGKPTFSD